MASTSSSTLPRDARKTATSAAIPAYLEIRGRVVEITEDGADDQINKLAKKYLGVDKYPYAQPSEIRVIYKIKPEHTTVMG
jgi:hypothetical protein